MIAMQTSVQSIHKGEKLLFLQSHTPGQLWHLESQFLKVLGLRDDLHKLRRKVHHILTVRRQHCTRKGEKG